MAASWTYGKGANETGSSEWPSFQWGRETSRGRQQTDLSLFYWRAAYTNRKILAAALREIGTKTIRRYSASGMLETYLSLAKLPTGTWTGKARYDSEDGKKKGGGPPVESYSSRLEARFAPKVGAVRGETSGKGKWVRGPYDVFCPLLPAIVDMAQVTDMLATAQMGGGGDAGKSWREVMTQVKFTGVETRNLRTMLDNVFALPVLAHLLVSTSTNPVLSPIVAQQVVGFRPSQDKTGAMTAYTRRAIGSMYRQQWDAYRDWAQGIYSHYFKSSKVGSTKWTWPSLERMLQDSSAVGAASAMVTAIAGAYRLGQPVLGPNAASVLAECVHLDYVAEQERKRKAPKKAAPAKAPSGGGGKKAPSGGGKAAPSREVEVEEEEVEDVSYDTSEDVPTSPEEGGSTDSGASTAMDPRVPGDGIAIPPSDDESFMEKHGLTLAVGGAGLLGLFIVMMVRKRGQK